MSLADNIIGAESGGDVNAQNPNSSAAGPAQFINSTWTSLVKQYRPDLANGKSDADILAMRADPQLSSDMVTAYSQQNAKTLTAAGLPPTPGNLYLAHFAGPQGAVNVLNADPSAPASAVMGAAATAANPFLKNMTIGDLRNWATNKVGGNGPQAQPSAPTPAPASPAPAAASPVGAAPVSPTFASLGMLNDPNAFAALAKQVAPNVMGAGQQQQQPQPQQQQPPTPAPQPMNLQQGTPAAQAMRQRLLASIFAPQQPQQ